MIRLKFLIIKIKPNKAQYILDRKNAEISAKSSGKLDKYEYLTGEDLGYKPDALTQAKFEYSPLGKVLAFGSSKEDKKEGILKRLPNINDSSDLRKLRFIKTDYDPKNIDYYLKNKDNVDAKRTCNMYSKLESIEEKFLMVNELYNKIEDAKNDDNILSDDINKKNRVLNNASKVYSKLLDNYKDEYLEQYEDNNEEWKKSMIIRILMIWQIVKIKFLI